MSQNLVWHSFSELDSAISGLESLSGIRQSIYKLIAAVLHLGNVNFESNNSEYAQINDEDGSQRSLEYAAELLAINTIRLKSLLLERNIKSGDDTTT